MWSRTWTAVVGSFTAGESALLAMSTIIRKANAGSWSKVRSSPSAINSLELLRALEGRAHLRRRAPARHLSARSRRPGAVGRARRRCARAHSTRPSGSTAWIAPPRLARTTSAGSARVDPKSHRMSGRSARRTACANVERAARATSAATATGLQPADAPIEEDDEGQQGHRERERGRVTPKSGTKSSSIRRSTENENVRVPTRTASVAFSRRSRYQRRKMRARRPGRHLHDEHGHGDDEAGERSRRTDDRGQDALAVDGEYCHRDGAPKCSSATETIVPRTAPSTAPMTGRAQRPSSRLTRRRNRLRQLISLASRGAQAPSMAWRRPVRMAASRNAW